MSKNILETLAALEHEQWAAWTNHFIAQQTPANMAKWKRQAAATYKDLPDEEKEADRIWARKVLDIVHPGSGTGNEVLYEGRHLTLKQRAGWEYVERNKPSGIVAVLAITPEEKLLLVEQYRPPVGRNVIEIPAGLAGDLEGFEHEAFEEAARRELLEETGYEASHLEALMEGPVSAGLSTEIVTFFRATGLRKTGSGGGDGSENICLHEVPVKAVSEWLEGRRREGVLVDCKVYSALFFITDRK